MTEEAQGPTVQNEAAFVAAIGINPGMVVPGTIKIEFVDSHPVVKMGLVLAVTWDGLGKAIEAGQTGVMPALAPVPEDHKPPARKTPPRKTTTRKK